MELRVPPSSSLLPYLANVNLTAAYRRWPWEKLDARSNVFLQQPQPVSERWNQSMPGQKVASYCGLAIISLFPFNRISAGTDCFLWAVGCTRCQISPSSPQYRIKAPELWNVATCCFPGGKVVVERAAITTDPDAALIVWNFNKKIYLH